MGDLVELRDGMQESTEQRDWGRLHDPKSLVLALVGELAELFRWLPADGAREQATRPRLADRTGEELADVLRYLVLVLDIDLADAARANSPQPTCYPAGEVTGRAPER